MKTVVKRKKPVVVERTSHPAAHRKIRCPKCRQGFAIGGPHSDRQFKCDHCGAQFQLTQHLM